MANRSYLYSCDITPDEQDKTHLNGIAEWNYDIPIVFKLLLSGGPKICRSSIWSLDKKIALVGDYDEGVNKLELFFQQIRRKDARELIAKIRCYSKRY